MTGPLAGVRVIEFGNLVAAPYCTMLLADLGADVIKVEQPGGDLSRQIGPFQNGESWFFVIVNRGKRSVVLDPRDDDGRHLMWELARQADVVVHNLRRGAMEKMGLGYAELASANPGLVFAVISAFGSEGPDADRAGIDLIFQGESGMMSVAGGEYDGPQKTATTIGDFLAGTNAAFLVAAALAERGATGRGRYVETSLRDGLIAVQGAWNAQFFATAAQPRRTGTASPVTAPNQTFVTANGYLNLAVVSDRHFQTLCEVLSLEALVADVRFASNEGRVRHRDELVSVIGDTIATEPTEHWLTVLGEAGLPVGRILSLPEVFVQPQVVENQMVREIDHPRAGRIRLTGSPLRGASASLFAERRPPLLGEHTAEVLAGLGVGAARLNRLFAGGDESQG